MLILVLVVLLVVIFGLGTLLEAALWALVLIAAAVILAAIGIARLVRR